MRKFFKRLLQAARDEERKEARYEELESRFDHEEFTQEEIEESVRLFYELHPELVDWE